MYRMIKIPKFSNNEKKKSHKFRIVCRSRVFIRMPCTFDYFLLLFWVTIHILFAKQNEFSRLNVYKRHGYVILKSLLM